MFWILPAMSELQYVAHVNDCALRAPRGITCRHQFSQRREMPSLKPQHGDRIYIRVRDAQGRTRVVAYHDCLGTNRSFVPGTSRATGWQALYSPHIHELSEDIPDTAPPGFATYNPPGQPAALPF